MYCIFLFVKTESFGKFYKRTFAGKNIITALMLLNSIHRPVYVLKHNVSETGLCLRPQVKPTLLGPIGDRG
jgi:hypothetical protein